MDSLGIVTKARAAGEGLKRYFTGKPCKRGHVAERFLASGTCLECARLMGNDYRAANHGKFAAYHRQYRSSNKEKRQQSNSAWRNANRELLSEYRTKNKEKKSLVWKSYSKANSHILAARDARRRASKLSASPAWLTPAHRAQFRAIYAEARRVTKETGVQHHVDHIVPLQGNTVCGLHVPWNLQVIPANDNMRKSNKLVTTG